MEFFLGVSLAFNLILLAIIFLMFYVYKHYIDVEKKGSDIVDKEEYNDFYNSSNNDRIFKLW